MRRNRNNANQTNAQRKVEYEKVNLITQKRMNHILREKKERGTPNIGPRGIFYHYIFDCNWDLDKVISEILRKFPSLDKDIIMMWYEEKTDKKERMDLNEGR